MAKSVGLLTVRGQIKLDTFYGKGGLSDADTVKLDIVGNDITFQSSKNAKPKNVANILLQGKIANQAVIKTYKKSKERRLTVRLQGIDAPELHYRATSRGLADSIKKKWNNHEFRQNFGVRATDELVKKMQEYQNNGIIEAYAFTRVYSPNEIFDTYGRFVGDVVIQHKQKPSLNINHWLIQKGWAFPAFYNSMSYSEIKNLIEKSKKALPKDGIWKGYTTKLVVFNQHDTFERKTKIDAAKDFGGVNFPKVFRRQIQFEVGKKAGAYSESTLSDYLNRPSGKDYCYKTLEFLKKGENSQKYRFGSFVTKSNTVTFKPSDLVIVEDTANDLKDSKGKIIESWNHK